MKNTAQFSNSGQVSSPELPGPGYMCITARLYDVGDGNLSQILVIDRDPILWICYKSGHENQRRSVFFDRGVQPSGPLDAGQRL